MLNLLLKPFLSHAVLVPKGMRAIFVHHDVSSPGAPGHSRLYSTEPARFREQIDFLRRHFRFVTLDELHVSGSEENLAALTFDDGFRSVKTEAHPVLKRLRIPYAVFACRDAIEGNRLTYAAEYKELNLPQEGRVFLDAAEVKELCEEGVCFGNHTLSHPVLSLCSAAEGREEIRANREYLRALTGQPVLHFAIPYGKPRHFDEKSFAACVEAGHAYIYSTQPSYFRDSELDSESSTIPRISLTNQAHTELSWILNRAFFVRRGIRAQERMSVHSSVPLQPGGPVFLVYSKLTLEDPAQVGQAVALRARGVEIHVILLSIERNSSLEQMYRRLKVPVYHVYYREKRSLPAAILQTALLLLRHKAGTVHTHLLDANLVGLLAGLLSGVPRRIYTRHHSDQNHKLFPHAVYYDRLANVVATRVVAISDNVKRVLLDWESADPEKITLINHGFDLSRFVSISDARVEAVKKKYGIPPGVPVVGSFSRYIVWKGMQYVVPAMAEVRKAHPDAFFVFANAFPSAYREKIIAPLLAELPKGSYVEIESETDVGALFRALDVFVHVPHDPVCEAFGMVYVEAMLAGTPSVFTRSGIAAEIAIDGKNCLLVDFKDSAGVARAVNRLLADPALREKITRGGWESTRQRFEWGHMLQKLMELYR